MPYLRKCANCGEPAMEPVEHKMELYNSICTYKCSNCGHEIELTPVASYGAMTTLGFFGALFVWFIFMDDHGDWPGPNNMPTIFQGLILLAIISFFPVQALLEKRKHTRYPIIESKDQPPPLAIEKTGHVGQRLILFIEKTGFIGSMLAPIIIATLILGTAAIIGFINFTYFDNNLFG